MIKHTFKENCIILQLTDKDSQIICLDNWLNLNEGVTLFNVVNDLQVNGNVSIVNNTDINLAYEELSRLDNFEYSTLKLPTPYPFDIFISIVGTGLKDKNLKLDYTFQDFAHGNGSGNILPFKLTGGHLNGNSEYLLTAHQYYLIKEIKEINGTTFTDSNEVLKAIGKLQERASMAGAVLSRILANTKVFSPENIQIDVEKIDKNKYKLKPVVKSTDDEAFQNKFQLFTTIQDEYHYRSDGTKTHIVIDDTKNEDEHSLKSELKTLKKNAVLKEEDIVEMYDAPGKFWDTDLIDLELFGKRVLELGIYKPKFHPFISPYKSEWLPGIVIEDRIEGNRHIRINNESELGELKALYEQAIQEGSIDVTFKGEKIDVNTLNPIIVTAEKQLNDRSKPITTEHQEKEKPEDQTKVIIIKENTEELEYSESVEPFNIEAYRFEEIGNLSSKIQLKDHQERGIAWLQTLLNPPYSSAGVLLADDMGLGKTLQVLYFIEWYTQKKADKPILIVAPVSLLENWQNEYEKFFPKSSCKTITLWGSNVRNYIITNRKEDTINLLSDRAIYLTTYETLRKHQIPLGFIDWGVVVLDEAQKIKTPGTFVTNSAKALKAEFKVAMTGTPVENSLMDLWCIVDFCSPGLLENAKLFHKKYIKPLREEGADYEGLANTLRTNIGDSLLRRMKIDVAKDLPSIRYEKFEEEMPSKQYQLYLNEIQNIEKNKENKGSVLEGIFNLRSLSDHPYLKHFQLEQLPVKEVIATSAKLKKTVSILADIQTKNEKAILFTENKSMQRVLRKILLEKFSVNSAIINGETPSSAKKKNSTKLSRQQEIDKFQSKEGFNAIVMSPLAAGFGLNVTEANHVIHYTRHWNPAKEQQATDRAYRIGQERPVQVYYPMAVAPNNEIDTFDKILNKLLERKSHLASSTLFPTDQVEVKRDEFMGAMGTKIPQSKETIIKKITELDRLNPLTFEAAISVLVEKRTDGQAYLTPKSNDKGADVVLFKDDNNFLIQVKQSSNKLGIKSGQEIKYAIPEYTRIYNKKFVAQVVTNNFFTQSAVELAQSNSITLIDRNTLSVWITNNPLTMKEIDSKLEQRLTLQETTI